MSKSRKIRGGNGKERRSKEFLCCAMVIDVIVSKVREGGEEMAALLD